MNTPHTDCELCAREGLTRDADGFDAAGLALCHEHLADETLEDELEAAGEVPVPEPDSAAIWRKVVDRFMGNA